MSAAICLWVCVNVSLPVSVRQRISACEYESISTCECASTYLCLLDAHSQAEIEAHYLHMAVFLLAFVSSTFPSLKQSAEYTLLYHMPLSDA